MKNVHTFVWTSRADRSLCDPDLNRVYF